VIALTSQTGRRERREHFAEARQTAGELREISGELLSESLTMCSRRARDIGEGGTHGEERQTTVEVGNASDLGIAHKPPARAQANEDGSGSVCRPNGICRVGGSERNIAIHRAPLALLEKQAEGLPGQVARSREEQARGVRAYQYSDPSHRRRTSPGWSGTSSEK